MAPNLTPSQHDLIQDMILDKKLKTNYTAPGGPCLYGLGTVTRPYRHIGTDHPELCSRLRTTLRNMDSELHHVDRRNFKGSDVAMRLLRN
jgi:hypothetical protein